MCAPSGVLSWLLKASSNTFRQNSVPPSRASHVNNAHFIDVELCKGAGTHVWDKCGKEYLDFIGGNCSLNLGHCHPKITCAVQEQLTLLQHTSRSVNNCVLPEFAQALCQQFNYDRVIVLNTANEACEIGLKLARLWGYKVKKICPKDAVVIFATNNYWGESLAAISSSSDPLLFVGFQPLLEGLKLIPFNDACTLEEALKFNNVCGFMSEPIQVEAGVYVPSDGYLAEVRRLCTQNKVLWIANETATGLGRTGHMLGVDHEGVKPDILCLGRALGGGCIPVSAALSCCEVMDLLEPGAHATIFGGSPLCAKVGLQTLRLIKEERLDENAAAMGDLLRDGLLCSLSKDDMPVLRGRGLVYALKIDPRIGMPCDIVDNLRDCGLLAWPCKNEFIRLSPPLIVNEEEITQAVGIIKKVVEHMRLAGKRC